MARSIAYDRAAAAVAVIAVTVTLAAACGSGKTPSAADTSSTSTSATPTTMAPTANASTQVAIGYGFACALVNGGQVKCWGDNNFGQLGSGLITKAVTSVVAVPGITDATQIAAGTRNVCVLRSHGEVTCWGKASYGVIADNSKQLTAEGIDDATDVTVGLDHSCAVVRGGVVKCWGHNIKGQLGNGTTTDSDTPVTVTGLSGATQVSAGAFHTCAVLTDGMVKCWGTGVLGDGTGPAASRLPVSVVGVSGATQVDAGGTATCAVVAGGEVKCWGADDFGQITDDRHYAPVLTPTTVKGITGATRVVTAEMHSCALASAGQITCWGNDEYDQLGIGPVTKTRVPLVPVVGISDATRITAGGTWTCAVAHKDQVVCWGANPYGLLGDGTTTQSATPERVDTSGASTGSSTTTSTSSRATSSTTSTVSAGRAGDLSSMNGTYGRVTITSPCHAAPTATTAPPPHPWLWAPACMPYEKVDAFSFVGEITIKGGAFKLWRGYGPDVTCKGTFSNVESPLPTQAKVTFTNVVCSRAAPDVTATLVLKGDTLEIEGAPYKRIASGITSSP